jgi:hypothetical protein
MAVIGIITCEILELEFAQQLGADAEVGLVSVLDNRHAARLIELLERRLPLRLRRLPHVHAFHPEPGESLEVLIRVLQISLHRRRSVLRRALVRAANELQPHVDALLLGYGLCGNALDDPRIVLDVDVPLFFPMEEGRPVDDCVALCLGGRERYCTAQREVAGTFFLTPGWSEHWRALLSPHPGAPRQAGLERTLAGYERVLAVQTPALADDELLHRGLELGRLTGLRLEIRRGTMDLLIAAWNAAKWSVQSATIGPGRGGPR